MKSLKFMLHPGRNQVNLLSAAILLAINQEPWADTVLCSSYDFLSAGYHPMVRSYSIPLPEGSSAALFEQGIVPEDCHFHRLYLRLDDKVPEGEVWLP